jgi:hypothetical protein
MGLASRSMDAGYPVATEATMDRRATGDNELRHLGEAFGRERLHRRLTVARAAEATRIRTAIIAAIERGDADSLPAPVFTLGLVRTYAQYLGLDAKAYITAYQDCIQETSSSYEHLGPMQVSPGTRRPPAITVPLVVGILLLVLAGYLYQQYRTFVSGADVAVARPPGDSVFISTPLPTPPSEPPTPVASASASTIVSPAPKLAEPSPTVLSVVASPTPLPTPSPTPLHGVRIDAQVFGRVWVQVEADDKVIFSGILNPGDARTWTATDKLLVWSGNGGNVGVSFNGKSLGRLGSPGEVVRVTWTATH